jgi:hypothetical protein
MSPRTLRLSAPPLVSDSARTRPSISPRKPIVLSRPSSVTAEPSHNRPPLRLHIRYSVGQVFVSSDVSVSYSDSSPSKGVRLLWFRSNFGRFLRNFFSSAAFTTARRDDLRSGSVGACSFFGRFTGRLISAEPSRDDCTVVCALGSGGGFVTSPRDFRSSSFAL